MDIHRSWFDEAVTRGTITAQINAPPRLFIEAALQIPAIQEPRVFVTDATAGIGGALHKLQEAVAALGGL